MKAIKILSISDIKFSYKSLNQTTLENITEDLLKYTIKKVKRIWEVP